MNGRSNSPRRILQAILPALGALVGFIAILGMGLVALAHIMGMM